MYVWMDMETREQIHIRPTNTSMLSNLAIREGRERIRRPLARVLGVINYQSKCTLSTPHTSTEIQL